MTTTLASPNSAGLITKVFDPAEVNFTPGERSAVAWLTTDQIDREGDVVVASGVDFKEYLADNPIVMAFHDYGKWPIGQCDWIKLRKVRGFTGLYGKATFDEDPDSELVWKKVKARTVRMVSIGFKPPPDLKSREWGPPTAEELRVNPHWSGASRVIRRSQLLEFSFCPIGMNQGALVIAVNKGLHRPAYDTSQSPTPEATMPDEVDPAAPGGETATETETPTVETKCATTACETKDDDMGDDEDDAFTPRKGDHVKCMGVKGGDQGCGEIKSLHRKGTHPADSEDDDAGEMEASEESPLAKVDMHDEKCMKTGQFKCFKAKNLKPFEAGSSGEKSLSDDDTSKPAMMKKVATVAKTIKHCGDYGQAFYNHDEKAVHHTMADSDGEPEYDGEKAIKSKYMAIKGIKKVQVGDEWSPKEEDGWEQVHPTKGSKAMAEGSGTSGGYATRPEEGAGEEDEDEDDKEGSPDSAGGIKTNDHVKVTAPHCKGFGVVKSIHTCGLVPHVVEDMRGTKEEPCARVKLYKPSGDGFVPTEHHVAVKCMHLTKVGALQAPTGPGGKKPPATTTKPGGSKSVTQPVPEPLPPLIPLTAEQIAARDVSRLKEAFSAQNVRKALEDEMDRRNGIV